MPREIVQRCHFGGKLNPEYLNLLERSDKMGHSIGGRMAVGFFGAYGFMVLWRIYIWGLVVIDPVNISHNFEFHQLIRRSCALFFSNALLRRVVFAVVRTTVLFGPRGPTGQETRV